MYIRIAADGSPKELAKLFRSIAESFEETEEKKAVEGNEKNEKKDEREG